MEVATKTCSEKYVKHGVEVVVWPAHDGHDSQDVSFYSLPDAEGNQEQVGAGYRALDDGKICIMRCPMPKCGRENYAMNISTGTCAWCGTSFND